MKDYYDILDVTHDASPEDIKRSYYLLVEQFHPNKTGGDESRFKDIIKAYRVLSGEDTRKQYDDKSAISNTNALKTEEIETTNFDNLDDTSFRNSKPYLLPVAAVAILLTVFAIYTSISSGRSSGPNPTNNVASSTLTVAYTNTTANKHTYMRFSFL